MDDNFLLTSGRDSRVRLWDARYLEGGYVKEYRGHKCEGYNIGAHFIGGGERYIITGSEDSKIYLYNKLSGNVERSFKTESKIVHFVLPLSNRPLVEFVHTGLEEGACFKVWGLEAKSLKESSSEEVKADSAAT
jgi:WD40 repeat protein